MLARIDKKAKKTRYKSQTNGYVIEINNHQTFFNE